MGTCRGILVGGCQVATGVHMHALVQDLGIVPGFLEQDGVGGVEADGPVAGVFVKDILDQVNDGRVIVLGLVHEPHR